MSGLHGKVGHRRGVKRGQRGVNRIDDARCVANITALVRDLQDHHVRPNRIGRQLDGRRVAVRVTVHRPLARRNEMVVGARSARQFNRIVHVDAPAVRDGRPVGLNSSNGRDRVLNRDGVRACCGLAGRGGHRQSDRFGAGELPGCGNRKPCGVNIVGEVTVLVGVNAGVNVPHKRPLLPQAVGGHCCIQCQRLTQGNRAHLIVGNHGGDGWVKLQSNRDSERLAAVASAQRSVRVVDHQEQFLTFKRGGNLPRQGHRSVDALQRCPIDVLHADGTADVTVVLRSCLKIDVPHCSQVPR